MKPQIRIGAEGIFCANCGATERVRLPIEIKKLHRLGKAFAAAHADCPKPSSASSGGTEKEGGA